MKRTSDDAGSAHINLGAASSSHRQQRAKTSSSHQQQRAKTSSSHRQQRAKTTGFRGVSAQRSTSGRTAYKTALWIPATAACKGHNKVVGTYPSLIEAAKAYDRRRLLHFGEDKGRPGCNFPEDAVAEADGLILLLLEADAQKKEKKETEEAPPVKQEQEQALAQTPQAPPTPPPQTQTQPQPLLFPLLLPLPESLVQGMLKTAAADAFKMAATPKPSPPTTTTSAAPQKAAVDAFKVAATPKPPPPTTTTTSAAPQKAAVLQALPPMTKPIYASPSASAPATPLPLTPIMFVPSMTSLPMTEPPAGLGTLAATVELENRLLPEEWDVVFIATQDGRAMCVDV